ncbi:MAG: MoaD family protein [Nitrososphaerota archaeon]|nr:MoaD family protein [Candidatus Bathyarchaeota archaeon]MDW8022720.1 MoaD family protein [Nitrososphaerota archaeon]
MARVKVMFQAMFRELAGKREIVQEVSNGYTLRDLLDMLAKKYGGDFNDIVDPKTGEVNTEVWVLINGKSVRKTDIKLNDDDLVYIGIPIGGG